MTKKRQPSVVIDPSELALSGQGLKHPITMLCRTITRNSKVMNHSHPWGQLIYADSGVMSVNTNRTKCIVSPTQAVWVPPSLGHEVIALSEVSLSSLYIDVAELGELPTQCCVLAIDPLTNHLIRKAKKIGASNPWGKKQSRLLRVLRDCIAECRQISLTLPLPEDLRLATIIDGLQRHPDDSKSLDEWGRIVGASPRTLARKFKRETELTFSEWRQRLKVQRAIQLLNEGLSVTTIALDLGYESTSAFIFMFKNHVGESPGKFLSAME